ncbi:MAG TPA: rubredoxin [Methanobacteriaceae archaeon]|nr:rubredoxin [Methanobacteriaceae archaeon]
MNYQCIICHYIYEAEKGDSEFGILPGTSFRELPDDYICPRCGIDKPGFEPLSLDVKPRKGKDPLLLMLLGLTQGLWTIAGKGSYSVTRQIGRAFLQELESKGYDFNSPELALESIKEYFVDVHNLAGSLEYTLGKDEVELCVKNCRFFSVCQQLEGKGVLISTCPYTNTSSVGLEKSTGGRYRIEKKAQDFGHRINLKKVS